jgi:hypothetical protein
MHLMSLQGSSQSWLQHHRARPHRSTLHSRHRRLLLRRLVFRPQERTWLPHYDQQLHSINGFIISVATLNTVTHYTAAFLYTSGSFSANALVYTWSVSSWSQTPERRAAGGAIVDIYGHLGNVMSPYFFLDSDSPRYPMAMIMQIVFARLTFCMAFGSKMYLKRQNGKLKSASNEVGGVYNPFTTSRALTVES